MDQQNPKIENFPLRKKTRSGWISFFNVSSCERRNQRSQSSRNLKRTRKGFIENRSGTVAEAPKHWVGTMANDPTKLTNSPLLEEIGVHLNAEGFPDEF